MLRRIIRRIRKNRTPTARPVAHQKESPSPNHSVKPLTLADWTPIDEALYSDWTPLLSAEIRDWLNGVSQIPILEILGPDIYSVQLFSEAGCQRLCQELRAFDKWARTHQVDVSQPNSMHQYGLILEHIHMQSAAQTLVSVLEPLWSDRFPEVGSNTLDGLHSFLVSYSKMGGDSDLGFHVDNSEVTLNITIQDANEGAEIYFQGRRCEHHRQGPHRDHESLVFKHQLGAMMIHTGAHRHGVLPIVSGHRKSIIMWLSSSQYRQGSQGECESWCGDHASA